jgi:arginine deiminase
MDTANSFLNVTSEIGNLKSVLMHRPGKELERINPKYLDELLFEDIPWLKQMQKEHDAFADVLRGRGCKVYYYKNLLEEILVDLETKKKLVAEAIRICRISGSSLKEEIMEFLIEKDPKDLSECMIAGLHKDDFPYERKNKSLSDYIDADYPFYINPLPNLYFTRDPGTVIGNGLSVSSMNTKARSRETMILKYIYESHPLFGKGQNPLWYDYSLANNIEGGDIQVLSDSVVLIGCSDRTSPKGIEKIAENLFKEESGIREVYAVQIPNARAYMHLDTVFTMLDRDKFTIYPGVEQSVSVYRLTPSKDGAIKVDLLPGLKKAVKEALRLPAVEFIQSGGGNEITAAREQWNDSTNTLAVAPGVVVTYNRNEYSNETLRKRGIEVLEIEGSELVRGRGGPHCMSMPLVREK